MQAHLIHQGSLAACQRSVINHVAQCDSHLLTLTLTRALGIPHTTTPPSVVCFVLAQALQDLQAASHPPLLPTLWASHRTQIEERPPRQQSDALLATRYVWLSTAKQTSVTACNCWLGWRCASSILTICGLRP